MKHIKIYANATAKNKDITRPRICMTSRTEGSPVYFDSSITITEIYSGSGTVQPKSTGTYSAGGNSYNYKYQSTSNPQQNTINLNISNIRTNSIVGLSINGGELIPGTLSYTATQGYTSLIFNSEKVYIYDYYKEPSSQGTVNSYTRYMYTKDINLTAGSTVTYKVYTW